MNVANPKVISELLTCARRKLPEVAEQNGMKPSIAAVVREHWIRRLTGVCVRCGHHVQEGTCPKCKTKAQPSLTLLEQLDPRVNIIRGECPRCGKPMTFQAGFVLQVVRRTGAFRSQCLCRQCQHQRRDAARAPNIETKKVPQPASPKVVKETAVQPKYQKEKTPKSKAPKTITKCTKTAPQGRFPGATPGPLVHRPFSALEGLKIEK